MPAVLGDIQSGHENGDAGVAGLLNVINVGDRVTAEDDKCVNTLVDHGLDMLVQLVSVGFGVQILEGPALSLDKLPDIRADGATPGW